MADQVALYDLTHAQLVELLAGWDQPRFRADQVWSWLYRSLAADLEAMANLPATLRARLAAETQLQLLTPLLEQVSASGRARKVLFRLRDGHTIESVFMDYDRRRTACISTQVGCGMGCTFCATGQSGLARNLSAGEIVSQVVRFAQVRRAEGARTPGPESKLPTSSPPTSTHPVSNVVLMGMGEPLANYAATWQAIETLADAQGYNLGARRITVSTVGLVPGLRRLAGERLPVNLAISLHAPDDDLRNQLVPANRRYPLSELMAVVRDYVQKTGRRVSFEYVLIAGVNDALEQARRLAALLRDLLCHLNLIPLNPIPGSLLRPSPKERVDAFRDRLAGAGIPVTVRMRRGLDIEAGCGQLRQRQPDITVG